MARIKAAILGTGLIAGKKHIPAFLKHKNKVELAALCDLNAEAAQKVATQFGIPKTYTDVAELIEKEKPDLIDICTPPGTHVKLAVESLRRGCHVLIEKPMALSVAECDEIVEAANKYDRKVCVGHSDLFYYPFMQAREMVDSGAIGEFRGMRIFLSTPTDYMTSKPDHWANKLPGGVIGESGPHVVYMTLAFINPIRRVTVDALKILDYPWSPYEDYRINLVGDKAISSISMVYTTNQWAARLEIIGSENILSVDLEGMYLISSKRSSLKRKEVGLSVLNESSGRIKDLIKNSLRVATGRYQNTHDLIVERFADSIINNTPSPVPAEECRESVRVLGLITDQLKAQAATQRA